MEKNIKHEELASALKQLYFREPYYGLFAMGLNRKFTDDIDTMGVGLNGINYELVIGNKFWEAHKNLNIRRLLLLHELMHLVFNHPVYSNEFENKKIYNIACDIEVHCYMDYKTLEQDNLHLCTVDKFPFLQGKKKMGTRWYYNELMKNKNKDQNLQQMLKNGSCGSGNSKMDMPNHNWKNSFEGLSDIEKEIIKQTCENMVEDVAETYSQSKGIGNMPAEIQEIIKRLQELRKSKFNWKGYLRRFVGSSRKTYTKMTRMKENRRIEGLQAIRIKTRQKVLVAIDTSGSVSTNMIKDFINEIYLINKLGYDVDVIECDTDAHDVFKFNPKDDFSVYGRGGTNVQPPCDYYVQHRRYYSCLIYFTDGECYAPTNVSGNILWVLPKGHTPYQELPGKVINIEY